MLTLRRITAAVAGFGVTAALVALPGASVPANAAVVAIPADSAHSVWEDRFLAHSNHASWLNQDGAFEAVQSFTPTGSGAVEQMLVKGRFAYNDITVALFDAADVTMPTGDGIAPVLGEPLDTVVVPVRAETVEMVVDFDGSVRLTEGQEYVVAFSKTAVTGGYQYAELDLDNVSSGSGPAVLADYSDSWRRWTNYRLEMAVTVTPPISAVVSGDVSGGWRTTVPAIDYTCDDGVTAGCPEDVEALDDGTWELGDEATVDGEPYAWSLDLNVDATSPTLEGEPTTTPGPDGLYTGPITVEWSCSDATSGVLDCPEDTVVTGLGADTAATATATDVAGNETTATVRGLVRADADRVVRTVTPAVPDGDNGWYVTAPDIEYSCDESVEVCPADAEPAADGRYGDRPIEVDGVPLVWFADEVMVDTTPPTLTGTVVTEPGANGLYEGDITVVWDCEDGGSGYVSCPSDTVVSGLGTDTMAEVTLTDIAGNDTTTTVRGLVRADATRLDRVITPAVPDGDAGWYVTSPSVDYTCAESIEAASCPDDVDVLADGVLGDETFVVDGTTVTWPGTDVKVDTTAPTLTGTVVTPVGKGGVHDSRITVTWTCADAGSGLAPGACPADSVVSGKDGDTAVIGTVTDRAGNETTTFVGNLVQRVGAAMITIQGVDSGATYAPLTVLEPSCSARSELGGSLPCTGSTTSSKAANGDVTFIYTAKADDPRGVPGEASVSWTVTAAHDVKVTGLPKKKKAGKAKLKAGETYVVKLRVRSAAGKVVTAKPSVRVLGGKAVKVVKASKKKDGRWTFELTFKKADRKKFRDVEIVTANETRRTVGVYIA